MSAVSQQRRRARAPAGGDVQSRRVFITKGAQGFGFMFSTNTKAYLRGINHFISRIDPGGEAEQSGLRVGDRILQIDNINTINLPHAKVIQILKQMPANRPIRLVVSAPNELIKDSLRAADGTAPGAANASQLSPAPASTVTTSPSNTSGFKWTQPSPSPSAATPSPNGAAANGRRASASSRAEAAARDSAVVEVC